MIYFRDFVPSSTPLPKPDPIGRAQNQLNPGDALMSGTSAFQLIFQTDGNLVLYAIIDATLRPNLSLAGAQYTKVIWATGTNGKGAVRCNMQTDGNLVLYTNSNSSVWASGTQGHGGAFLRCQDDGNLVIYGSNGAVLWSSKTFAGSRGGASLGDRVPPPPPPQSFQISVAGGEANIFLVSGVRFTPNAEVVIFVNPVFGQFPPTQTKTKVGANGAFTNVQVSAQSVCSRAGGGQIQIWATESNQMSNTVVETCH